MKKSEVKILIVDSPEALKNGYARNLQSCGYAFDTAISTDEALRKIQGTDYSLVLTELRNKNIDGLHFLQRSKSIAPYMQTAVLASSPSFGQKAMRPTPIFTSTGRPTAAQPGSSRARSRLHPPPRSSPTWQ